VPPLLTTLRRLPAALPSGISRRWLRRVLLANLTGQVLIVLSGGIVRLTGSGLGCPTFPQCVPGSYIPVVTQPQGFHKFIEFGNRMLTFVLTVLAVAALVAVWRYVRSGQAPRRLLPLGAVPIVGVFAQALIGGISVLTQLNPTVVAIHFLVSMVLIAGSTVLLLVAVPSSSGPGSSGPGSSGPGSSGPSLGIDDVVSSRPGPRIRVLAAGLAVMLVPMLALGTVVTGSGPHSGDANDPNRFSFDIQVVARLHSGSVWVFTILLVALLITLRRTAGRPAVRQRALILLGLTVAQGVVGYVQYALGVPIALVAVHMLGASLMVVTVTATVYAAFSGTRAGTPAGAESGSSSLDSQSAGVPSRA
jgi:cytochrome c oxidase assembly protein subunit 15